MKAISALMGAFWVLAISVVGLYAFFVALGAIAPSDPLWLGIAMVVLAALAVVHFVRVRHALADHNHDDVARAVHAMRERRGF